METVSGALPPRTLEGTLIRAEGLIALLGRARAINAGGERARLISALAAGRLEEPRYIYAPAPEALPACRHALDAVIRAGQSLGEIGGLYAARAGELALEAEIVSVLGTSSVVELARRRFPESGAHVARWCDAMATEWLVCPPAVGGETVVSDDASDPRSLLSVMRAEVGRERLPVRVVVTAHLEADAATGDDAIYVRSGRRHSPLAAERIALHEVRAHAMPRVRARSERCGLYRTGTPGSGEDEEGRALLVEREAGLLNAERRRDLALRHVAARAVRSGATWVDTVRLLQDAGARAAQSVDVAARAHRGGGLARESTYLPALYRVDVALRAAPELEGYLARGRLSLHAAGILARLDEPRAPHGRGLPAPGGGLASDEIVRIP